MLLTERPPTEATPIVITGGFKGTEGGLRYAPKNDPVSAVRLPLDGGWRARPASLPEAQVLEAELRNVRTKITAALHDTSSHRDGEYDDLLALVCAVWAVEHSAYAHAVGDR